MDVETSSAMRGRVHHLKAVARAQQVRTAVLLALARTTRVMIQRQIQVNPVRRLARVARGGSDSAPLLLESRQRRCPHCGSEALRLGGDVRAVGGLVKSELACETCGRMFVFVRRVIGVDSPRSYGR